MNRKLVAIMVIAGVFIVGGILLTAYFSNGSGSSAKNNSANNSGSTTVDFSNEDDLINNGLTNDQVSNLEQALEQYLGSQGKNPAQVGFSSIQIVSVNKNEDPPVWTMSFTVQLNGKDTYDAKMDYFNPAAIRLYLYNPGSSNLLYDSQYIGGSASQ